MSGPFRAPQLADEIARKILSAGVTTLARMTHEAEYASDDLTFIAVINEVESRNAQRPGFLKIYRDEYMRIWPEERRKHEEKRP